jgi:hypothetical protein
MHDGKVHSRAVRTISIQTCTGIRTLTVVLAVSGAGRLNQKPQVDYGVVISEQRGVINAAAPA